MAKSQRCYTSKAIHHYCIWNTTTNFFTVMLQ